MNKSMTQNEFNKKIQHLIENIKRETTVFPSDTKFEQRKRLEKSENDIFYFAKTYFPHYIKAEFGKDHKKVHRETEIDGQITAIAGYRGFGKTTFLSIIKPIWKALHGKIHFNCKVAQSRDLAKERTEAIRVEFMFNKRLKHDFGEQLVLGGGEETDFVIKEGCRFLALGYKSGIRGKIFGSHRPDYVDIDDLEDHKSFNERIAQDKLQFVTEEAYGALYKGKGSIIWLGNLTHQKSALHMFKKKCEEDPNPQRQFLVIKADNGDFNPTWKENYTKEDLLKIYNAMGSIGYERHMRMNPIIEGITFKAAWFKYGLTPGRREIIVTYCDPSLGSKKTSDYKAILTVGLSDKKYNLLDCYIRKATIPEMIKKLYAVDREFNTTIFMEDNLWQQILWEFIPDISVEEGYLLPVNGVTNKQKKELRIEKLQPLFEWGWINFPANKTQDIVLLEDQLLGFPAYPNDDGPDALAGAIEQIKTGAQPNEYKSQKKRTATKFSNLW